jgi:magnesium-transporting ATPase (P-type)
MEASATTATNVAPSGLSAAAAQERRRRGEANTAVSGTTRGYGQILRSNVFSFFNTILFVIGIALLVLGRYSDAFTSVGLGLVNAMISAVQEIRAKRKLDRLQLLDRAAVTVVRDGREVEVAPAEVVRGDVLRVRAGNQIVVDGPLLDGRVEADESLLTGESDPVVKDLGDELRSGSLCVAGDGHQLARDVGAASYAGRLTAEARRVTTDATPLQRRIAFVVRLVIALTVLMSGAILAQAFLEGVQPAAHRPDHGGAVRAGADVADIVLVDDSFAALLPAQREGRKIINEIATSMYVFLARVASQGLVIVAVTMLGLGFPYSPTQVGLTLLTVGVPTLFLTFWARPTPTDANLLGNLARFVLPAALVTAGFGTAVYALLYESVTRFLSSGRTPAQVVSDFESYTGLTYTDADFTEASATIGAQTGLSTFICLASFLLILFLFPPTRFFAAWTPPTDDRRPTFLVVALLVVFAAVLFVPTLYDYFGLTAGNSFVLAICLITLVLWFGALTAAYRFRLLDRALGLDTLP